MINTTICYLEKNGCYLLMHRTKKKNDCNEGKWIGVGGKMEPGESPEDCARREILEETGLRARELRFRAVITFLSQEWEDEMMYLFTSSDFEGELRDCEEGELAWIPKEKVLSFPTWEGDLIFLKKLLSAETDFFSLKLSYVKDELVQAVLWENGREKVIKG